MMNMKLLSLKLLKNLKRKNKFQKIFYPEQLIQN